MPMQPGDYIKIRLSKFKEIEGTILESYDKNIVLLKLKSGYNIGIPKENILDSKLIRKFNEKEQDFKIPSGKGKPSIGLIVTGGTIASKLDSKTGGVKPLTNIKEFARFYPKLFEKVNVKKLEIPFMLDSSSMSYKEWITIAKISERMLNDSDINGIIITHGTDTLHYTSAILSFFLRNLNKPIVLTYSQRSTDRASSDAELNLECAAEFTLSDCAEVVIIGHASMNDDFCYALSGTKVRKMHTSRRDAFKPINNKPIAKVWQDKIEFLSERKPRNKEKVTLDAKFNDKVALIKFYPGQNPDILDFYKNRGYKGIIIEALGLGQIASSEAGKRSWTPKLKKLIKEGIVICTAPQTIYGRLAPKVYSVGRELEDAGVIYLEDILSETALMKLGWVLGHRNWKGKVKEIMLTNIAGEFNELLTE